MRLKSLIFSGCFCVALIFCKNGVADELYDIKNALDSLGWCSYDEVTENIDLVDLDDDDSNISSRQLEYIKICKNIQDIGVLDQELDENTDDLAENYQNMKDTETSFENRMLGGATMAAMGIGGMEMARGIAEQNADNEADAIMDAYLKTFQCQIGEKGKTYSGGERNIEVPGANVLTDLYQQYTSIAESIKTKKTALGMRPGIESEIVLDKSGTGLYENAGTDTQSVKYASRYRAAMGSEKDTEDLQTETNKTTARALGGAAGVVGGATMGLYGNSVINGDNQNKSDELLSKRQDIKVRYNNLAQQIVEDCNNNIAKFKESIAQYQDLPAEGIQDDIVSIMKSVEPLNGIQDIPRIKDIPVCR